MIIPLDGLFIPVTCTVFPTRLVVRLRGGADVLALRQISPGARTAILLAWLIIQRIGLICPSTLLIIPPAVLVAGKPGTSIPACRRTGAPEVPCAFWAGM